jgi:hypothetical protein
LVDRTLLYKVLVCIAIVLSFETAWMARNYQVHGIATLSSGSAGGLGNVAAFAREQMEGTPYRQIRDGWLVRHMQERGDTTLNEDLVYEADLIAARKVIAEHPWEMLTAYLTLTWENLHAVNQLPRSMLPEWKSEVVKVEYFLRNNKLNYICFILSILGIVVMLFRRNYIAAFTLALVYLYFVSMIGFTRWQGSRLFFPGQIAWSILIAAAVWYPSNWLARYVRSKHWFRR